MKQFWDRLAAKIDALSTRERVFLFFSVFVLFLGVVDTLWLTPAQTAYRQLSLRYAAQSEDLQRLRTELQQLALRKDPAAQARDTLAAADARAAELDQQVRALVPGAPGGLPVQRVLLQFLRKQPGLTLLGTATLEDGSAEPTQAGDAAVPNARPVSIGRRGVELRVTGTYAALQQYVKTLETALPELRWGVLQISTDQALPVLRLQVYVMEVQL